MSAYHCVVRLIIIIIIADVITDLYNLHFIYWWFKHPQ